MSTPEFNILETDIDNLLLSKFVNDVLVNVFLYKKDIQSFDLNPDYKLILMSNKCNIVDYLNKMFSWDVVDFECVSLKIKDLNTDMKKTVCNMLALDPNYYVSKHVYIGIQNSIYTAFCFCLIGKRQPRNESKFLELDSKLIESKSNLDSLQSQNSLLNKQVMDLTTRLLVLNSKLDEVVNIVGANANHIKC